MCKYKDEDILYSDTDSIFTTKELSKECVGTELGQMKLEKFYNKFISLAPKVYGGITNLNKEVIKIKGANNTIKVEEMEHTSLKIFRNFTEGN
jgi:hypothetical protein